MPNQYSHRSKKRLKTCHMDLEIIFCEVLKTYDHSILDGHRMKEEQNSLYEKNLSKLKFPLSKHNKMPSEGVDVAPWPIDWKNTKRFYHFAGYVFGIAERLLDEGTITHKIRWGGDWDSDNDLDDQNFMDLVHFETVNPD